MLIPKENNMDISVTFCHCDLGNFLTRNENGSLGRNERWSASYCSRARQSLVIVIIWDASLKSENLSHGGLKFSLLGVNLRLYDIDHTDIDHTRH